jgi:hypothetical protein
VGQRLSFNRKGSRLAEVGLVGLPSHDNSRRFPDVCLVNIAHSQRDQGKARPDHGNIVSQLGACPNPIVIRTGTISSRNMFFMESS